MPPNDMISPVDSSTNTSGAMIESSYPTRGRARSTGTSIEPVCRVSTVGNDLPSRGSQGPAARHNDRQYADPHPAEMDARGSLDGDISLGHDATSGDAFLAGHLWLGAAPASRMGAARPSLPCAG